jgi:hypothetical protein
MGKRILYNTSQTLVWSSASQFYTWDLQITYPAELSETANVVVIWQNAVSYHLMIYFSVSQNGMPNGWQQ